MILHINHIQPGRANLAGDVVTKLLSVVEESHIDPSVLSHLDVHFDWIQYKTNFREPVCLRRTTKDGDVLPLVELAVDLRQAGNSELRESLVDALRAAGPD